MQKRNFSILYDKVRGITHFFVATHEHCASGAISPLDTNFRKQLQINKSQLPSSGDTFPMLLLRTCTMLPGRLDLDGSLH
jgi:hypothetical protein